MKYYQTTTEFNCGIDQMMNRAGEVLVHRNIRDNDFDFFLKLVLCQQLNVGRMTAKTRRRKGRRWSWEEK